MSVLNQLAYFQKRRDEKPNQELARQLVARQDKKGIREVAANVWNENAVVQGNCVKVLSEIGLLDPKLIAPYADTFIKLLTDKNNRLVWGSMEALATIASLEADVIYKHTGLIEDALAHGSIITRDNGIKTLSRVAGSKDAYRKKIFPFLLSHLATTRSQDIPQHSEHILAAVDKKNRAEFIRVLEIRLPDLTPPRAARVKKVITKAGEIS